MIILMKRFFLFGFLCFMLCNVQIEANDSSKIINLQRQVIALKSTVSRLQQKESNLRKLYQKQEGDVDSLKTAQQLQSENVKLLAKKFTVELTVAKQNVNNKTSALYETISARTWIGGLSLLIFIVPLGLTYYRLKEKIKSGATTIDKIRTAQEGLEVAQKAMQEESVKLDSKLVELLDKKIETKSIPTVNEQADHTLALKVADEIVRIETNLSRMDPSVKGYKQLAKAVERIRTNFLANGYEIVEMLGKPYNEGIKASVSFESDESLEEGEQRITGIIKPQINYKGKMIQSAQITVSQNL